MKYTKIKLGILINVLPLILFACWSTDPDAYSELNILNGTGDTLVICYTKINADNTHRKLLKEIYPYEYLNYAFSANMNQTASVEDMINDTFGKWKNDTVKIFKTSEKNDTPYYNRSGDLALFVGDTCFAKWGGPFVALPANNHNFFNSNSWVLSKGGIKCKCTIATFTITEEDLKTNNN